MLGRQLTQHTHELPHAVVGRRDAGAAAELLDHVDSGAAVGCVQHQMNHALGLEDRAQRAYASLRVAEMMQHAGADDLVKARLELRAALDGKLTDGQIVEPVASFQLRGAANARGAEIDTQHRRSWPANRILCSLARSAPGNEDGK